MSVNCVGDGERERMLDVPLEIVERWKWQRICGGVPTDVVRDCARGKKMALATLSVAGLSDGRLAL
jgi:hypothetical protein